MPQVQFPGAPFEPVASPHCAVAPETDPVVVVCVNEAEKPASPTGAAKSPIFMARKPPTVQALLIVRVVE